MRHRGMIVSVSPWVPGHRGEAYTGPIRSSRRVPDIPVLRRGSWGPAIERCAQELLEDARLAGCNAVVGVEIVIDLDDDTVSVVGQGMVIERVIEPLASHEPEVVPPRSWWSWLAWWRAA